MALPPWFAAQRTLFYEPPGRNQRRKVRLPFLDRTLKAMAALLEDFVLAEKNAGRAGILRGLDPRAKLLGILLLVVCTSLLHSIALILGLCGLALVAAVLLRIEAFFFVKRVGGVLLFFAGLIALPATLNLFTPGEVAIPLFHLDKEYRFGPYLIPGEVAVTRQGIATALLLAGRVATSVSLVLLLTATTPWTDLLKALRLLRVPQVYVQVLGMALRYLLLLSRTVREVHIARNSRTIRPRQWRAEQRWVAGQVAMLFERSMRLSLEVHGAMVARGYGGEVRVLSTFHFRRRDYLWLAACAGLAALLIYGGR